eukprot:Lankesteria_metandrocarpae@DN4807_c0_g1_i2.p1
MTSCPNCGSTDVASSDARGELACAECGTVIQENVMVESVSFGGDSRLVGQYVSFNSSGGSRGGAESRELALQRGRYNIQKIAELLKLPTPHQESAQRIYMLCVQRGFTIGRLGMHVGAACLYCICRRQKTPHMLIDFSDALRVPVRTIGRIFVKMIRLLHINVPEIDPSLFMERYANRLPLGDKRQVVASTAVRLIQAMTRDWIATGRRPSGLCGAALLISSRLFGFRIRAEELVPVVRISSYTLQKRLQEFSFTSSAALTAEEFDVADIQSLPILNGPPCYEANKRREAKLKMLTNLGSKHSAAITGKGPEELSSEDEDEETESGSAAGNGVQDTVSQSYDAFAELPSSRVGGVDILEGFFDGTEGLDPEILCSENPTTNEIVSIATDIASVLKRTADQNKEKAATVGHTSGDNSEVANDGHNTEATTTAGVSSKNSVCGDATEAATENDVCTRDDTNDTVLGEDENNASSLEMLLNEVCERQDELLQGLNSTTSKGSTDIFGEYFNTQSTAATQSDLPLLDKDGDVFLDFDITAEDDATTIQDKTDGGEMIESLSDVSDSEVSEMMLSEKEKRNKALIWDEMTKGIIGEVHRRFRDRRRRDAHNQLPGFGAIADTKRKKSSKLPEATTVRFHRPSLLYLDRSLCVYSAVALRS